MLFFQSPRSGIVVPRATRCARSQLQQRMALTRARFVDWSDDAGRNASRGVYHDDGTVGRCAVRVAVRATRGTRCHLLAQTQHRGAAPGVARPGRHSGREPATTSTSIVA